MPSGTAAYDERGLRDEQQRPEEEGRCVNVDGGRGYASRKDRESGSGRAVWTSRIEEAIDRAQGSSQCLRRGGLCPRFVGRAASTGEKTGNDQLVIAGSTPSSFSRRSNAAGLI